MSAYELKYPAFVFLKISISAFILPAFLVLPLEAANRCREALGLLELSEVVRTSPAKIIKSDDFLFGRILPYMPWNTRPIVHQILFSKGGKVFTAWIPQAQISVKDLTEIDSVAGKIAKKVQAGEMAGRLIFKKMQNTEVSGPFSPFVQKKFSGGFSYKAEELIEFLNEHLLPARGAQELIIVYGVPESRPLGHMELVFAQSLARNMFENGGRSALHMVRVPQSGWAKWAGMAYVYTIPVLPPDRTTEVIPND